MFCFSMFFFSVWCVISIFSSHSLRHMSEFVLVRCSAHSVNACWSIGPVVKYVLWRCSATYVSIDSWNLEVESILLWCSVKQASSLCNPCPSEVPTRIYLRLTLPRKPISLFCHLWWFNRWNHNAHIASTCRGDLLVIDYKSLIPDIWLHSPMDTCIHSSYHL